MVGDVREEREKFRRKGGREWEGRVFVVHVIVVW